MENNTIQQVPHKAKHSGMILIAILGGLLLAFGLGKLLSDLWPNFGPLTRVILCTFGFIIAHTSGYFLTKVGNRAYTGTIFHLIGIFLLPVVFSVFFREMQVELSGAMKSFIMTFFGALAYIPFAFTRRTIFVLAGSVYGFLALRSIINLIVGTNPVFDNYFDSYSFLVLGISFLFLGFYIKEYVSVFAKYALNLASSIVIVSAGLSLSDMGRGYGVSEFALWDIWFPALMVAMLYGGMKWGLLTQSILAIIGLLATLGILIGKYFDSISLPIILSIAGLVLIVIAYFGVSRNKVSVAPDVKM